jgi:hypothetical protein
VQLLAMGPGIRIVNQGSVDLEAVMIEVVMAPMHEGPTTWSR